MGLHLQIKHGRKLTFCIATIAKREKEWKKKKKKKTNETRKVSSIIEYSETIQPKQQQKEYSEILYTYLHSTFVYQNLKIANRRRNHIKFTPKS